MKIAYYIQHFPYENVQDIPNYFNIYKHGGAEIAAYNLAVNVSQHHEVHIFTTSKDNKDSIEKNGNMTIHRYGKNFRIVDSNISVGLFLKPELEGFDIIHVHLSVKIEGLAALIKLINKKIPLIVTHHADTNFYKSKTLHKSGLIYYTNKKILNYILSKSNLIISPSEKYINDSKFLNRYKEKVVVIPNGINIDKFRITESRTECRSKLGLPLNKTIILFLGSLIQYKGPDILLKSFKSILTEFPDTLLIFCGDGIMKAELKKLAKDMDIEEKIRFTGFVEGLSKIMYLKSADIFCLPSTMSTESFGIVNLEAMATGTPIISSRIGGIPDIVHDGVNGILVSPADVESLTKSMIKLIKNPNLRSKMVKEGKKIVINYSWKQIASDTISIYEKLLEQP